jgi:hypothetical protein
LNRNEQEGIQALWRAAGWPTALRSPGFIPLLIAGGCLFFRYDLTGEELMPATTAM